MADSKPTPASGFNLSSISGILNTILGVFSAPEVPLGPLPPPLLLAGAQIRPGLSAESIAAEIISKQSNAGKVVGDVFADGPNVDETMELIRIQEIINALMTDAKIEIVIPAGLPVQTVGIGNLGAPVVSFGTTSSIWPGYGVIR